MSGRKHIFPPSLPINAATDYLPSKYDREYFLSESDKSKRFEKLKPEVVLQLFSQRKSFEYVKEVALDRLEKTIYDQLEFLTLGDNYDYSRIEKTSHNIFAWSKKEFFKRRIIKNPVWVDVLKLEGNKDSLQGLKIRADLNDIKALVKIIFKAFRDKISDVETIETSVWEPIREAEHYLNILEFLQEEHKNLIFHYRDLRYHINAIFFNKRQSEQQIVLRKREREVLNSQALEPIEHRYRTNWYKCKTGQAQLKKFVKENLIQKELNKQNFDLQLEEVCGSNICNTYFALSEQYKSQMNALQARFDTELEAIDNDINYTRIQIKKLQDRQQLLTEEIGRFHEEIQECYEKEERQRQEEEEKERLRLEHEAMLEMKRKQKEKLKAAKAAKAKKAGNVASKVGKAKTKSAK